ncbi:Crp/Fnr family transcriptional regulator [Sphingobacterium sp. LRF_L2]|uniref:Crp/Fnr family transcriptional regulator n=1 Tax=Sphingobacterium sp. LRF_L2 TaxID=3369421 RepID=UPI003F6024A9
MKQKKKAESCDHSCFMCRYVIKDWHRQIDLSKETVKLKKGQQFISAGEAVRGVYFVESGLVKVHRRWGEKEMIVRFAKKGDIVGHRGVTSSSSVYPISATALEATNLCFVDLDFFLSTLRVSPELSYHLMLFYADELQLSEQKMCNLVQLSVKDRLVWSLLLLYKLFGDASADGYLGLNLSRKDIAAYIGTTYETTYRMLNELVEEGGIKLDGKRIFIENIDLLHQYIVDENAR